MDAQLQTHVDFLASEPRPAGSAWHARCRAYIREQLTRTGYVVTEDHAQVGGLPLVNVLTEPMPARPELPLVVVGAHYDSIAGSPGADDNASAVAALLKIAALLMPILTKERNRLTAQIQFAAYDLEESGLLGSARHARTLRAATTALRGMIALEMLGYRDARPGSQRLPPRLKGLYPDVGDFIGVVGNRASQALFDAVVAGLRTSAGLHVEGLVAPGDGRALPESRLSDHTSFWDAGYPALMVTDTSFFRNPHYHQATDTPDTLDYAFLTQVTHGLAAGVESLLRAP